MENSTRVFLTVLSMALTASFSLPAQSPGVNTAFAVTYSPAGSLKGTEILLVDLRTGKPIRSYFENRQDFLIVREGFREGWIRQVSKSNQLAASDSLLLPTATSVAATAFDERHNRLYFCPLGIGQLRYLDLSQTGTATFHYLPDQGFGQVLGLTDVPHQVTRMVIDPEGRGWALTNDGEHLLRFSTEPDRTVTDLGKLQDAPSNMPVSIHNSCTSYGGGMVSDPLGKLYLITASNYVFSIDSRDRVASYLGTISGLPPQFASNGAAVDDEGELVVGSSANLSFNAYYKVSMPGLKASPLAYEGPVAKAADLANGNWLGQAAVLRKKIPGLSGITLPDPKTGKDFDISPNPILEEHFNIRFRYFEKGDYLLRVQDLTGIETKNQLITIYSDRQTAGVDLPPAMAQGLYFVLIINKATRTVYSKKIVVLR